MLLLLSGNEIGQSVHQYLALDMPINFIIVQIMVVRVTKFRHILGEDAKKSYNGVPISKNAHESDFCTVNPKFVGIVAEQNGGGAFLVLKADKLGQIDANSTKISKHRGAVYDIRYACPPA